MVESTTLIPIWSLEKTSARNKSACCDSQSLSYMLSVLSSSNVSELSLRYSAAIVSCHFLFNQISEDDELPKKMCLNCVSEMNQAFSFKQKCERSEETLLTLLKQTKPIGAIHDGWLKSSRQKTEIKNSIRIEKVEVYEVEADESDLTEGKIEVKLKHEPTQKSIDIVNDFIAETTLKFNCSDCKATFSSKRSLSLHINSRKCMQLNYECDICHKVFIKKRYLIRHLQRMHHMMADVNEPECGGSTSVKRKYKCNLCPKGEKKIFQIEFNH